MHSGFVPLRVFSSFTMLEGAIEPKAIAKRAKELGFPAVAVVDRNGLYASMSFGDACMKAGIQPIIGTLLAVKRPDMPDGVAAPIDWLALYAQDEKGYLNLCDLVSMAHLDRPLEEEAHIPFDALDGRTDGLLCLTAGAEGALARLYAEQQDSAAAAYATRLEAMFPDRLYIEIVRRLDEIEGKAEPRLLDLAYDRNLPLVATNPSCFAEPTFHEAHDAMLCIANSSYVASDDRPRSSPDAWMKPATEMKSLFSDLPEGIANTLVVAQRCAYAAPKRKPILPSLAGDREGEAKMLRDLSWEGLEKRLEKAGIADAAEREVYEKRLQFELDIIIQMGFPGYFLIVADFIQWAKAHDIPVGPGRGSGAGSAVAWALTITDLDPLKLGLLFERFLNPERVSMPDFDIDFCETRRGEVIRYVQQKYGSDHVAQIITFGTMKARAVIKSVGRVLQMSYGQVDRLAKQIPNHPTDPWTLERTLNGVSEFLSEYNAHREIKNLVDLSMQLEGLPSHSSTHAAGVVIGDRPLSQLVPLYRDPRSDMPVTQFDMKYVEGAGLVKFDFLGLKTLSVLKKAVELLADRGLDVDLDALAWDDTEVYDLLQRGDTVGVFQLESEGMRRTLTAVRPTNFGDIIALVSLYRPGPMDNIPSFGHRKGGREEIIYPHDLLEPILKETYGIFVYQEQVMQAAQILAGYSLGGADMLRRAMGKKIKAEMDAQRETFVKGCAEHNGIKPAKANELFDLIDKFAGYGFNKSHAAAYALLAYQTAWLKAHHPHEFFAASMAYDIHQTDKLAIFVDDMKRLGISYLSPDINRSQADFFVEKTEEGLAVRYALGALKGVGEGAMEELVRDREERGVYKTLDDFALRTNPQLINKRQLETLAAAGAFDSINDNRAGVYGAAERIMAVCQRSHGERNSFQASFDMLTKPAGDEIRLSEDVYWSTSDRTGHEREAFGFYFQAHPLDRFQHLARSFGAIDIVSLGEVDVPPGTRVGATLAVLIEDCRPRTSARGNKYVMASISDKSAQTIASCFEDSAVPDLERCAREGGCAVLTVELDKRAGEDTPRVSIKRVQSIESLANTARLVLDVTIDDVHAIPILAGIIGDQRGGRGEVLVHVGIAGGVAEIVLGRDFRLDGELRQKIENVPGIRWASLKSAAAKLAEAA
ncbi:DNA polymerase III subunit alpha [Sphingomonas kyeonggiensis]|uniref:DNA polymerase III subunit alpha n=1 Tax=Sphingomonas kyeonggiensis TaxID=1268553 RepID=A0A7W6JQC9_9SPHN|nr:DNA polymerase III subunit alpha [Sphingomonas kyeonggiensis]MBB4097634.1 DNA polymerase-3 subunit alpha [Sphingomonas kyeonggiensis]